MPLLMRSGSVHGETGDGRATIKPRHPRQVAHAVDMGPAATAEHHVPMKSTLSRQIVIAASRGAGSKVGAPNTKLKGARNLMGGKLLSKGESKGRGRGCLSTATSVPVVGED